MSTTSGVQEMRAKASKRNQEAKAEARSQWAFKEKLQSDRESHVFEVEMYGRELPFHPLPQEAAKALNGKRSRMAHCAQNGHWEELVEQADSLVREAPKWLCECWEGPGEPLPADWNDLYDDGELLELLNKVDSRGGAADQEAVISFLQQ